MAAREARIHASENSLTKYYLDMMFVNKSCIYDSLINDELRGMISRWRLSNHDLKIDLGRYSGIPREERVCDKCDVLENEQHVVFVCDRYREIRQRYQNIINKNRDIQSFLNPSLEDYYETAAFLLEIESFRKN